MPLDRPAGLAHRLVLLVLLIARLFRVHPQRRKQERIQPPEIARNVMGSDDLLDTVDRRLLALLKQACGFLAANFDERAHAVVANRREVGGGTRGHSAANRATIDNDHRAAGHCEFIGDRESGNAGPHHHGVAALAALKLRRFAPPPAASTAIGWPLGLRSSQPAAFRFTFFSAIPVSFLSAAFSSLSVVVRSFATGSLPSSSAQAISVP